MRAAIITSIINLLRRDERGVSMVIIVGVIGILSIMGSTLIFLANQTTVDVKRENLTAQAVNIGEAGISSYVWKLNNIDNFYETTSDTAELDWVKSQDGEYRLSVTPQTGRPGVLVTATARVPVGNSSPPTYVQRNIQARIEKKSFAQYSYVTDSEELEGGGTIWFITGDTLRGPLHSNDIIHINGDPTFEGKVTTARTIYKSGGSNPDFQQGYEENVAPIELPSSNQKLKDWAEQDGYYYYGNTTIVLQSSGQLEITNNNGLSTGPTGTTPLPPNGVVYVDGLTSTKGTANNGDAYVEGTLSGKLTIAAKNTIYITDDIVYNDTQNDMMGLVAENYILINHFVGTSDNDVAPVDVTIYGAIFALNHSFGFERFRESGPKGTLTVHGSIAQRFRGPVGTFYWGGAIASGYSKAYYYDDRMLYEDPPHFTPPLNSGFEITNWQQL